MSALPATMRQVAMRHPGGAEVLHLVEAAVPRPGPGEVLIRVAAAGVNRPDLFQRMGAYPPPPDASPVLGLEVAGEIADIGPGVDDLALGDAVCALTPGGGYAGYCTAPALHVLPKPRCMTMVQAAALPETLFTVWGNVFMRAGLVASERFLVHGGGSGIGTMAIQLARVFGATVLTTANGARRCAALVGLGANTAIDHATEDFVAVVRAATEGRGVDVILDMVGGDYFPRNIEALAEDGRLVSIAFLRGSRVTLDFTPVMRKRLTLTGSTLRAQSLTAKARIAEELRRRVWPRLESGDIAPVIERCYPLEEVAAAHRHMEAGGHLGKLVLTL